MGLTTHITNYIKSASKAALNNIPPLKKTFAELEQYRQGQFVPPGHFYSPIPSLSDIKQREATIFRPWPRTLPAINLNEDGQIELFEIFKKYYREQPFQAQPTPALRYYFENPFYSYSDAITLYSMIRYARPKRIIEIGSGFSSAAILDTNDRFFDNRIACTFIDPDPRQLHSLLKPNDAGHINIIPQKLQSIDQKIFFDLRADDILFVDSTHVAKVGSDVNTILFEILPQLHPRVYIHFHDIFYPFEYPKEFVYQGIAWNEDYLLRAFLQYNSTFRIVYFNTFLEHFHREKFQQHMPLCLQNPGGSLWIKKSTP